MLRRGNGSALHLCFVFQNSQGGKTGLNLLEARQDGLLIVGDGLRVGCFCLIVDRSPPANVEDSDECAGTASNESRRAIEPGRDRRALKSSAGTQRDVRKIRSSGAPDLRIGGGHPSLSSSDIRAPLQQVGRNSWRYDRWRIREFGKGKRKCWRRLPDEDSDRMLVRGPLHSQIDGLSACRFELGLRLCDVYLRRDASAITVLGQIQSFLICVDGRVQQIDFRVQSTQGEVIAG